MTEIIIQTLSYPENVRKRTGMYLGETDNFTTPLREIINNSQDEMLNGYASFIQIINNKDYKVVIDNGRGLPCYENPNLIGETITKEAITTLHSGSKFDNKEVTTGLNGVGSSVVNAVSDIYIVYIKLNKPKADKLPKRLKEIASDGTIYYLEYNKGVFKNEGILKDTGKDLLKYYGIELDKNLNWSTIVLMKPDLSIYESSEAIVDMLPLSIVNSLREENNVILNGEKVEKFDFLSSSNMSISNILCENTIKFEYEFDKRLKISGEFAYSIDSVIYDNISLINLINTTQGGFIEQIICNSLGDALNDFNPIIKRSDSKLGLILYNMAFSSYEMSFNSQTKEKLISLGNKKIAGEDLNKTELSSSLKSFFKLLIKKNKEYFEVLCERIIQYKANLNSLSNADYLKSKVIMGGDSKKRYSKKDMVDIYEASSDNWKERELYIPEGRSASGNLIKYRDKKTQSILPIRGKLINTTTFSESDLVDNKEILTIINAVGCGVGQISDIKKSKYGKIIIAGDSDQDASHIANLITALFLIHIPDIIKEGMLYRLIAPFYKVTKNGKVSYFYLNEKDKIDFENCHVVKRKGLGSYTPEEAKKFMMDKNDRRLIRIEYPNDKEQFIKEAIKLLYSSNARKKLMEDAGIL